MPVCAENLVRLDLMKESLNVSRDGGIPPVPADIAWLSRSWRAARRAGAGSCPGAAVARAMDTLR